MPTRTLWALERFAFLLSSSMASTDKILRARRASARSSVRVGSAACSRSLCLSLAMKPPAWSSRRELVTDNCIASSGAVFFIRALPVSRLSAPTAVRLRPDPRLADSAPPQDIDCELHCKNFGAPLQRDERRLRPSPPGQYVPHQAMDQRLHGRARVVEKGDGSRWRPVLPVPCQRVREFPRTSCRLARRKRVLRGK